MPHSYLTYFNPSASFLLLNQRRRRLTTSTCLPCAYAFCLICAGGFQLSVFFSDLFIRPFCCLGVYLFLNHHSPVPDRTVVLLSALDRVSRTVRPDVDDVESQVCPARERPCDTALEYIVFAISLTDGLLSVSALLVERALAHLYTVRRCTLASIFCYASGSVSGSLQTALHRIWR